MPNCLRLAGLTGLGLLTVVSTATAAPNLRVQVDQKGDFVLLGNTFGHECAAGTPAPVVGTVGNCGNNTTDSSPDIFWRADAPMTGQASANNNVTVAQARSSATLIIPAGASVTHAYLYWAGIRNGGPGLNVTLERSGGFSEAITALQSYTSQNNAFQSLADVTTIVQTAGPGSFRVSGVDLSSFVNANDNNLFGGWWMVVFYALPSDPLRNLAIFDGLDTVLGGQSQVASLTGFLVPTMGFTGKLGVVAFEGDNSLPGDQLFFNGGAALSNAENPVNNFFNGTRSFLGAPVSVVGDLPQLTGTAQSHAGMDLDVVDVTSKLTAGQTSATIQATSTQDIYHLAGWVTSVSTFRPDFSTSLKSAVDVNGGSFLPGDVLQYTVVVTNTGNDSSINTVLTDALPTGVTYVPASLSVTAGVNMGPKTDAAADDQGDYDAGTRTVRVRLGTGANAAQGGTLTVGESTTISFQVTVDAGVSGTISNQAIINAAGLLGAPPSNTPTDGNGGGAGTPPTDVVIDECLTNAECPPAEPVCDSSGNPNVCVQCLADTDCPGSAPTCDPGTDACICVASGNEMCNGLDDNCDGTVDEGCDPDGDGLSNDQEEAAGTDPNDADSDDDGVPDGQEPSFDQDTDGDGLINALDPDSDDDGLFDGTELGLGCGNPATNAAAGRCKADADMGATTTDPLDADTDDGGVNDGAEDTNLNGVIDAGETDPTAGHGADDNQNVDTDGDGLSDDLEETLGTDPHDADTDDDGVRDGLEPNPGLDTDGDGRLNALDPDSDDDGLFDGTELGLDCSNPATDTTKKLCVADADGGATVTSPIDPDTDDGGVSDGSEDVNLNGQIDAGETDPTAGHAADDSLNVDTDGDGLSDGLEDVIGTDPHDADSDDDGVIDGQEPDPTADGDGDGLIDARDPDSDGDGLFDGTELGLDCSNPATDPTKLTCIADADSGATTTSPLDPDTDDGGVNDGDEDANHNGAIDNGERNPNDPADDVIPSGSGGAGGEGGAGAAGGNGPSGSSTTTSTSSTGSASANGGAGPGGAAGTGASTDGLIAQGSGCACRLSENGSENDDGAFAAVGLALALTLRRRRRAA